MAASIFKQINGYITESSYNENTRNMLDEFYPRALQWCTPDTFKPLMAFIFDNFEESEAKKLANSFIGELGRKYNKTSQGFTWTEYDTAMCCWTAVMAANRNVTIDYYNDLFLIREQEIERLKTDNTSINRFVVSEAILKCLQLLDSCFGKDSKLYSYNTDGIFISNPKMKFKNKLKGPLGCIVLHFPSMQCVQFRPSLALRSYFPAIKAHSKN